MTDSFYDFELDPETKKTYFEILSGFARMASNYPERIGEMREALKFSASMMISNRPEAVKMFQQACQDVDSFLAACESGELDPKNFIIDTDKMD